MSPSPEADSPAPTPPAPAALSADDVAKVARLAQLNPAPAQAAAYAHQLSAVLEYVQKLRSMDLTNVEPMTSPLDMESRLDADEPGPTLDRDEFLRAAPDHWNEFVRVPRVIE
jgi:aspartyl-tRNA(Asn)/glutamyl-tRNA(Gln) amidotransferase subunit C